MQTKREMEIAPEQIKIIHTLKTKLGLSEESYRGALFEAFGVDSCKDLTQSQAQEVLKAFECSAIEQGVWAQKTREEKFKALRNRPDFATPEQLGFIETLWRGVTRAEGEQAQRKALRAFLKRQSGASDLRFLRRKEASKVITALRAMRRQQGQAQLEGGPNVKAEPVKEAGS
jgi:hypothetical protein